TVTLTQSGLTPSTSYTWQVYAVTEGALSTVLAGTQSTLSSGFITSTGSGNWGSHTPNAPWPGGVVPTASDVVTIANGSTITINTNAVCWNLTVGQGTGGVLRFEATNPETLAAGNDVTVSAGATFTTGLTGTQTSHLLSVGRNLTNNGVLDLSTNGNTAGGGVRFSGSLNATFGGSGTTTDLQSLIIDKTVDPTAVVTVNPPAFTVQGITANAPGFLTPSNGIARLSGTYAMSSVLTASAAIPATGGVWLDNPNLAVLPRSGAFAE